MIILELLEGIAIRVVGCIVDLLKGTRKQSS